MMMRGRGPMGAGAGDEKAHNFRATMVALALYMREYRLKIILVVIFAVLSTTFTITDVTAMASPKKTPPGSPSIRGIVNRSSTYRARAQVGDPATLARTATTSTSEVFPLSGKPWTSP